MRQGSIRLGRIMGVPLAMDLGVLLIGGLLTWTLATVVLPSSSPDLIIIGGGVSKKSEKWFKYLKARARIVPARMNNDAGIVGAALAWEQTGRS